MVGFQEGVRHPSARFTSSPISSTTSSGVKSIAFSPTTTSKLHRRLSGEDRTVPNNWIPCSATNSAPACSTAAPPPPRLTSRGSEGGSLWVARLTWTRKREGTTAWRGSVEHCEGVDGAATQGPCDMAKTRLFEAQFPALEMCILRHITPGAEPPASGESPLLRPNPSGWWAVGNELTQGNRQAA